MARRVFFSFHYQRDIRRVVQIRNSWLLRPGNESQPFYDKPEWEKLKRTGPNAITSWIERQLTGTSVTVVLIGNQTHQRKWVLHEIQRSIDLRKGIVGIYIHNVKDPQTGTDYQGLNPLEYFTSQRSRQQLRTYDWVLNEGYRNMSDWIDSAAKDAGR